MTGVFSQGEKNMNIGITPGKENLILTGQAEGGRTPEQALQALLQEGKVLSARVLAQSGNNTLLKLADLLIPVKTDAQVPINTENVMLKVVSTSPEKTLLEMIPQTSKNEFPMPEVKINFTLPEQSAEILNKIAVKPGESLPVKVTQAGENTIKVQIGDQSIELKPELQNIKGENIKVRLDLSQKDAPRLILLENGAPAIKAQGGNPLQPPQASATAQSETPKPLVFKEENIQLLNKLVAETKTQITVSRPQEGLETALKLSFNENDKTLATLKNMGFDTTNLKEGQFKNQEALNLTKLEFNPKTQMAEGFIKDDKLLLKPILEFKDNNTLVLKFSNDNNKPVFTMDTMVAKENEKVMNQLAQRLGEFILKEKDMPEIIKGIIDNKIPLTKENINTVQNFVNFFPGDAKTGMDMLLNQNLLMGLYYQLNNSNDKFLIKGYEKRKGKREGREKAYDFSILYESEKLGSILVDLEWSQNLNLDFYCEEEATVKLIEDTLDELTDKLKIDNIKINVEHNQEKIKKEPIKAEKITLSNIDISV